jgi:hypothetical protein
MGGILELELIQWLGLILTTNCQGISFLTLKAQGIEFLAQAGTIDLENTSHTSWKKDEILGLVGEQKEEWNNFIKGLVGSGFDLNSDKDTLLWSWDTKGGQVNAKQAYEVQMMENVEVEPNYWYVELWTWQLPLKVKLFIWLMLEQRILTWENLVKRGIYGPSRCVLCGNDEETVYHLFVDCSFTKDIWFTIIKDLKLTNNWEGGQIVECLQNWIRKELNWKEIPCFICWEVWKHMNLVIFEDHPPNLIRVCNSILQDLGELKSPKSPKLSRVDRPPLLDWDLAVGFFDGASQDKGAKCGAGACIEMSS